MRLRLQAGRRRAPAKIPEGGAVAEGFLYLKRPLRVGPEIAEDEAITRTDDV